ncbi:MAG: hypothetical protein ACK58L_18585 [Planctomycetota bacterium]
MTTKRRLFIGIAGAIAISLGLWGYVSYSHNRQIAVFHDQCPSAAAANDWRRLKKLSSAWLELDSANPTARFWMGEALQNLGDYPAASDFFQQIPLNEPRGVDAAIRLMHIQFFIEHKPSLAMQTADRLLEFDKALPEPIQLRVYFFAMTFQREKLLREIQTAIQCRADLPEHYVHLMILEDLSFRDGKDVVRKWVEHDTDPTHVLADSLFVHTILSERDAAVVSSEKSGSTDLTSIRHRCSDQLKERKTSPIVLEVAIRLELEAGNQNRVAELLEMVPALALEDPVFWLHRGKYCLDANNIADARSSLDKAIQLYPLAWRARGYLATVERLEGHLESGAALQTLAAEGSRIAGACLQLKTSREIRRPLLREIYNFASSCQANDVARAILRRIP